MVYVRWDCKASTSSALLIKTYFKASFDATILQYDNNNDNDNNNDIYNALKIRWGRKCAS